MPSNWYVYIHRKKTNLDIFYIGIGKTNKRYKTRGGRNRYWKNVVDKHGFIPQIIKKNLSRKEANELEQFLISLYGRKEDGGVLTNITIGGDGVNGVSGKKHHNYGKPVSEEVKKKIRETQKGRKKNRLSILKMIETKNSDKFIHPRERLLLNTQTGIYYNLRDAAFSVGVKYNTLKAQLNGQNPNKTFFIIV